MKRSHNRFTALLMAVLMLVSNIIPSGAFAIDEKGQATTPSKAVVEFAGQGANFVALEDGYYIVAYEDGLATMFAPLPTSFSEGHKVIIQQFYGENDSQGNPNSGLDKEKDYQLKIYKYSGSDPLSLERIRTNNNPEELYEETIHLTVLQNLLIKMSINVKLM